MSSVPDVFIIISCRNEKYSTQFAVGVIDILIVVVVAAFLRRHMKAPFEVSSFRSTFLSTFPPNEKHEYHNHHYFS